MKKKKNKVVFPTFVVFAEPTYEEMTPKEYVEHIESYFKMAVKYLRLSGKKNADLRELLVQWGIWSRQVNKQLRWIINQDLPWDPQSIGHFQRSKMQYKLAYAYWWNRTHYLETFRKNFFGQISSRKHIDAGKKNIMHMIIRGMGPEEVKNVSPEFYDLVERLSKKKELSRKETDNALDGKPAPTNDF